MLTINLITNSRTVPARRLIAQLDSIANQSPVTRVIISPTMAHTAAPPHIALGKLRNAAITRTIIATTHIVFSSTRNYQSYVPDKNVA
jgi:hypothetical protein